MKKILFVVNTMGRAGAETALLELMRILDGPEYEVSLYVILAQGEMIGQLQPHVKLKNQRVSCRSVMTGRGKLAMAGAICSAFFRNGGYLGKIHCIISNFAEMKKAGKVQMDKLLWRMLSDGAVRTEEVFDLAVAYLEGASAYYVADHVKARHKAGFIHIDYRSAGYTRRMDRNCWGRFDRIFGVSDEVRDHFLAVYPEYGKKTEVFHNIINQDRIRSRAKEEGGFPDGYTGARLLTVGRLTYQKAYDIAIEAMKLVKDAGFAARWYVLGEGSERRQLEKKIAALDLKEDFVLLGAVTNPYPYYVQADIYVHATRYEGKSIAIQEAQTLGCAVIASDRNGNREQIKNGHDGILCELDPQAIAKSIIELLEDKEKRKALGGAAAKKDMTQGQGLKKLLELL